MLVMADMHPKNHTRTSKATPSNTHGRPQVLGRARVLRSTPFGRRGILVALIALTAAFGVLAVFRSRGATTVNYQSIAPSNFCPDTADYNRTKQIWAAGQYQQLKDMAGDPAGSNWGDAGGYSVPESTATAMEMALGCGDTQLISELADVYLNAAGTLQTDTLNTTASRMRWQNSTQGEQFLSSQQWFYGLTRTLTVIAATPAAQRTERMNTFVSTYRPVISGYYKCWIWIGCKESSASNFHPAISSFINEMYDNESTKLFKYGFDDRYQWPVAAVAQLYMAYKADPSTVDLTGNNYAVTEAQMVQFIKDSAKLLKQRSYPKQLTNLQGQAVIGYDFDQGFLNDYQTQYSGYEGPCFPIIEAADQAKANALAGVLSYGQTNSCQTGYYVPIPPEASSGWDFSHAWRIIPLYTSMYTVRSLAGTDFPVYSDMQKLTNQLAYAISNKDMNYPRFKNFWGGQNGWYRLNYSGRVGFGYAPWAYTTAFMENGFGLLAGFNPDLRDMTRRIRDLLTSTNATDVAKARDYYAFTRTAFDYTADSYRDYATNPNSRYWYYFLGSVPPANFTVGSAPAPTPTPTATPVPTPTPTPAPTATPVAIAVPPLGSGCRRMEAETMILSGPTASTYNPYYSASGYVENFGVAGAYIETSQSITTPGTYTMTLRYGAGAAATDRDIYIDGTKVTTLNLPQTSTFASWGTATSSAFALNSGSHTIRIQTAGGAYANLDYGDLCLVGTTVTPTPAPTPAPTPTTAPTPTPIPNPCTKSGDTNCDGKVNNIDLQAILSNYGKRTSLRSSGDLTGDGVVNIFDLSQVLQNWGR